MTETFFFQKAIISFMSVKLILVSFNGELIPYVTKFTLLGIILEEYLIFDLHTISLGSKVNRKISVLKKSSCLFNINFRKHYLNFSLFLNLTTVLPFFYFNNLSKALRIERNFANALQSET